MTDLRQAAQQALEALDKLSKLGNGDCDGNSIGNSIAQKAREKLRTALEQQAPFSFEAINTTQTAWKMGYEAAKAEQQAEPVFDCPRCGHVCSQREWVGLTPEEVLDLFDINNVYGSKWVEFARTVENKLKKKNA